MQKLSPVELRAACELLREALPDDFSLRMEKGQSEVAIHSRTAPRLALTLNESPELGAPAGTLPVLVFRGTKRERETLRRRGQSFIDLTGEVHLKSPHIYVDRVGLPPVFPTPRTPRTNAYGDRASQVVRTLLHHPQSRRWTTSELADAATVDPSTVSRVVRALTWRELVRDEAPGQGRTSRIGVRDPYGLLLDWARRYSWEDNRHLRVAAPIGSPSRFIPKLSKLLADARWALSLQAGASFIAPHASFDVIHLYVDEDPDTIALRAGWASSANGKLVLMEPMYRESIWFDQQVLGGTPVVSSVQLVLDLWHYPVRGREQAEHIIETVLRPIWTRNE